MRNIRQNLAFAFAYNIIGTPIAAGIFNRSSESCQSGGRGIGDVTELRISDRECAAPAVGQAVMDDFVPDHIEPDCADYIRSIFLAGAHDLGAGPHAALDGRTPDQAYSHPLPLRTAA